MSFWVFCRCSGVSVYHTKLQLRCISTFEKRNSHIVLYGDSNLTSSWLFRVVGSISKVQTNKKLVRTGSSKFQSCQFLYSCELQSIFEGNSENILSRLDVDLIRRTTLFFIFETIELRCIRYDQTYGRNKTKTYANGERERRKTMKQKKRQQQVRTGT